MSSPGSISSNWLAALARASLTVRSATSVGVMARLELQRGGNPHRKQGNVGDEVGSEHEVTCRARAVAHWLVFIVRDRACGAGREQSASGSLLDFDAAAFDAIGIAVVLRPGVRHKQMLALLQNPDAVD